MMQSTEILLSLLLCIAVNCSVEFFREFLEPDIFSAHGFHLSTATLAEITTVATEADAATYFCGPLSDLRRKMAEVSKLSTQINSTLQHKHVGNSDMTHETCSFLALLQVNDLTMV